jgi:hypothetical protein
MRRTFWSSVVLSLLSSRVGAEESSAAVLVAPFLERSPVIDGILSEGEWSCAARAELVYQVQPGDNSPPSERTEIHLAYDARHLYLAVAASDSDAEGVRGRITRRDDLAADDYLRLYLDTYDDRRRAYVFSFNPLGIQSDGLYNEGSAVGRDWDDNIDWSWDGVLESKGRANDDGYVVEAAIPFKSLRYASGRAWGLHVERWIARKAERVHWRPISRDESSLLVQMGTLSGLDGIAAERALDVIPSITASLSSERVSDDRFVDQGSIDPGVTSTWTVTPNVTLAGTANPDFSQVEADVPQIQVNQRFPLFFPEKRPFFLEGQSFFRSAGALTFLDTRQVVDPVFGVKLTGKVGRNAIATLVSADEAPGLRASPASPEFGRDSRVAVGRYQRDLFSNSIVGLYVTDQRFSGSSNTVLAADGNLRFRENQVIGFQGARSWTRSGDGAPSVPGQATYLWYELQGRHWRLFVNDLRLTEDYRSLVGFVRRTGIRSNSVNLGYELQSTDSWYVNVRPFVVVRYLRTDEGLTDESYVDPGVDLTLPRDVSLYIYHSFHRDGFLGREYDYQFDVVDYVVNTWKTVRFEGRLQFGEGVNFDPENPRVGRSLDLRAQVNLKPDERLDSQFLYLRNSLSLPETGERLFEQDIYRNRTNFQFTRFHAVRSIIEYDSFSEKLAMSFLYSFTPRPNSAIYFGYGDVLEDPLEEFRRPGLRRVSRVLFLKLSHGFRP